MSSCETRHHLVLRQMLLCIYVGVETDGYCNYLFAISQYQMIISYRDISDMSSSSCRIRSSGHLYLYSLNISNPESIDMSNVSVFNLTIFSNILRLGIIFETENQSLNHNNPEVFQVKSTAKRDTFYTILQVNYR